MTSAATDENIAEEPMPSSPAVPLPALILDCELSDPISDIRPAGESYLEAWILLRLFAEPVGFIRLPFIDGAVTVNAITEAARAEAGKAIAERVTANGGDPDAVLSGEGSKITNDPIFIADQERLITSGPKVTVVICTRDRPDDLDRAIDSLQHQRYRNFDVLVVDNAPPNDSTRQRIAARPASDNITYTVEPRKGLSWARNCAIAMVTSPYVAWMDDDETADPHWLVEIMAGFDRLPNAAAVSGIVIPAEVRTQPQLWFEQYGGHSKGRGFVQDVFDAKAPGAQSPLFPVPPFGVGANMAFNTEKMRAMGFDNAMGAGTLTCGCEDTLIFSRLLLAGEKVVYQPTALMRHYHREDWAALTKQMYGYGAGLTAFYTALLRYEPKQLLALFALIPSAARTAFGKGEVSMRGVPEDFPTELLRYKTRGMIAGPVLYLRAASRARRARRSSA
ncbi:GT2 family glycosyltransferase [Jatrophihabitans sp. GAS493]|uniref:glycosyltransferase n=1 Tax=Jatrophihabitans sp. GAS493 TaxID=1907575 RepID=UPI000BC0D48B|nr:glycosyltransferase family 2 protein [Jatrophihabitans sp. GAS493]SOD71587.1 GT2 family glycosyltransferase [Jatrophihabitans sp. GAS493]